MLSYDFSDSILTSNKYLLLIIPSLMLSQSKVPALLLTQAVRKERR